MFTRKPIVIVHYDPTNKETAMVAVKKYNKLIARGYQYSHLDRFNCTMTFVKPVSI